MNGVTTPIAAPKRKSPAKAIALAIGIPCVGCGLVSACVLAIAFMPGKTLPVRDDDKAVVLRASDLERWIENTGDPIDEAHATLSRTRDLFGVEEIQYEYSRDGSTLFVNSTVTIDPKESDARTTFNVTKLGLGFGVAIESKSGMTKEERNDLFSWGDDSASYVLEMDGSPVGNAVVARKGARTFFVIFAGVYFDDAGDLEEVLEPHLDALESWTP